MNQLKKKLKNKELSIGTWVNIGHQSVIEVLGMAGFDWVTLDIEHSPMSLETIQNLLGHIRATGMEGLVRVSKNEEVIIKRVMDAGADGIIVPMVNSEEDAKKAVNFVRYPPHGKRGVGLSRAQKYGYGFSEYKEWTNNNSCVIAQIEHIQGVNNLEAILTVNGIDGIIIGPYDLSASMGYPGEYERDEVKEALRSVVEMVKKSDKSLGFHVIESKFSKLKEKIDQGYTFLAFSLDFFFLGDRAREEMEKLNQELEK
ncbi:MAG: 2,4-dihydroxyhept-2-ene-1,7-dioic acid aldolase [Balneola sp.]|nr:2,4-dihydroxyhept-2-ene-1,7-dioic acid aldolase [Balneola sp.]|tara:strand:+ start:19114 stop:19884 length:771 start_codon:yes stop_codon:yes gene_type:complete